MSKRSGGKYILGVETGDRYPCESEHVEVAVLGDRLGRRAAAVIVFYFRFENGECEKNEEKGCR
jgi:hypothetical protein